MSFSRLQNILLQPTRAVGVYKLWFGKYSGLVAWIALTVAIAFPPHGFGASICWFKSCFGLPCPTCGLTRSLSCACRGMFVESWNYHPLGLLFLALFTLMAGHSLLSQPRRARLQQFMEARTTLFYAFYLAFAALFVTYGTVRAGWFLLAGQS